MVNKIFTQQLGFVFISNIFRIGFSLDDFNTASSLSFHLSKRTQKQDGRGHFGCVGYNKKRKGEGGLLKGAQI